MTPTVLILAREPRGWRGRGVIRRERRVHGAVRCCGTAPRAAWPASVYIERMQSSLAGASLTVEERAAGALCTGAARAAGGGVRRGRARAGRGCEDASWDARMWVRGLLEATARELGIEAVGWRFSIHVHT